MSVLCCLNCNFIAQMKITAVKLVKIVRLPDKLK